ncbi:FadR/GntR family transcriptional regulator [Teichococcus vastitatis]|jgi:DNA-binding FadR family transcriptional regulator|uniref:FCD domain-containing protein n=1 Tax=Teichococcus vastitatis TaxID=2307076 RepID=A0ABS9WAS5_9PROT|nr:FCD domain-containing protein [Pseudoroseomonas vastitatis]MCI0756098.1 FCD domain-containing protein [Pseudoroseomonas vastitatis]
MVNAPAIPRLPYLVSSVAAGLRDSIRNQHSLGDKLPTEAVLAERFGVSRTVIREAVATLRTEGLLETRQGSGIFVARTRQELVFRFARSAAWEQHLRSIYELRLGLEVAAAGLAAIYRTDDDLQRLEEALAVMAIPESRRAADLRFHTALAAASRNEHYEGLLPLLAGELSVLIREAQRGCGVYKAPTGEFLVAEHRTIHEAILQQDADAARAAMEIHLHNSARRFDIEIRGMGRPPHSASAVEDHR